MNCDEYQLRISALLDGEVGAPKSAEIFGHMGTCPDCRLFWHNTLALNAQLEIAGKQEEHRTNVPLPQKISPGGRSWNRPIEIRAYALSLFLCALISLSFLAGRSQLFGGSGAVYVTKLPPVIITSDTQIIHTRTEGELQ